MEKINFKQLLKCGERIVIPMIQRDYAQERKGVENIREPFINANHTALMKGRDLNLDFRNGGKVHPTRRAAKAHYALATALAGCSKGKDWGGGKHTEEFHV